MHAFPLLRSLEHWYMDDRGVFRQWAMCGEPLQAETVQ